MRLACLVMLSLTTTVVAAADLYRTVAADGSVVFSDRPMNSNSELISVNTRPPPSARADDVAAEPTEAQRAASTPGSSILPNTSSEELAAQIAENCDSATAQLDVLLASDRLYRVLPDGGHEYLSSEDVELTREQARKEVARWCE
jgi:hypothetical protein